VGEFKLGAPISSRSAVDEAEDREISLGNSAITVHLYRYQKRLVTPSGYRSINKEGGRAGKKSVGEGESAGQTSACREMAAEKIQGPLESSQTRKYTAKEPLGV